MADSARGLRLGAFDLEPEHPPLTKLLYGAAVMVQAPRLPAEEPRWRQGWGRYDYARAFYCEVGNDPERLARASRAVGAAFVALLVLVTYAFTRGAAGPRAALFAAALVATLPDVLAHGGVAYNDLPLAPALLLAVWALDALVRAPGPGRGALAGLAVAAAVGVKLTAVVLAPIALALALVERRSRRRDRAWARALLVGAAVALLAGWALLAALYRDLSLGELWRAIGWTFARAQGAAHGEGMFNAYLLGELGQEGWPWFYPLALFLKTPVGFHLLALTALGLGLARLRVDGPWAALRGPLRAPALAALVLGAALVASGLNIGFRHALPLLPLLCVLVAVGVVRAWERGARPLRVLVAVAALAHGASTARAYPDFLAYTSEYVPAERGYSAIADSSLDWGQGLLALRRWMAEVQLETVALDYFGSLPPEAYGIRYRPERAAPWARPAAPGPEPEWLVVSATYFVGLYTPPPLPYAHLRGVAPDRVLAGSLLVFRRDRLRARPVERPDGPPAPGP